MNCYGAKELADSFRTVRKNTLVIAEEIPEEQYGYRAAPETRSVSEMLIHIAVAPGLQQRMEFVHDGVTRPRQQVGQEIMRK